jgi:hypothetical protein
MTIPTGVTIAKNKMAITITVQILESREGNVAGLRSPMPDSDNEPVISSLPLEPARDPLNRPLVRVKPKSSV